MLICFACNKSMRHRLLPPYPMNATYFYLIIRSISSLPLKARSPAPGVSLAMMERLSPQPSQPEGCATRKVKGVGFGDVERSASGF
jgi:hypothetical protein